MIFTSLEGFIIIKIEKNKKFIKKILTLEKNRV